MSAPTRATLRLAGFATAVALITSRLGLVVHELVGHGAAANAMGAGIDDVRLFWFAGGWIRYHRDTPWPVDAAVAVQLGGIAIQLVAGLAVLGWAWRRTGWLAIGAAGFGAGWAIHAAAYLAIGTWHGFGDGALLHRALGGSRAAVAVPAAVVAAGLTFVAARALTGRLAATIPAASRGRQLVALAVALGAAGGIHAGLARAELAVRADATYGRIMAPERDRAIDRELAAWLAEQRARGAGTDPDATARERDRLERARPAFPFGVVVVCAIGIAGVVGAAASRRRDSETIDRRTLGLAALAAIAAVATVIGADAVFPL